jgi:hypothetical protein
MDGRICLEGKRKSDGKPKIWERKGNSENLLDLGRKKNEDPKRILWILVPPYGIWKERRFVEFGKGKKSGVGLLEPKKEEILGMENENSRETDSWMAKKKKGIEKKKCLGWKKSVEVVWFTDGSEQEREEKID